MGLHTSTPIYKVTYDLLQLMLACVLNMPRNMKGTLGQDMLRDCVTLVKLVYRANVAQGSRKVPHLDELIELNETLTLCLRLCLDSRFISHGRYAAAVKLTSEIGKQAGGWRRKYASPPAA
ncbi:MAG: four helix bundle protein [Betaproteobacteria bacterium]|nr:four helix bundle protein [Betaproteobacteria bacterium]